MPYADREQQRVYQREWNKSNRKRNPPQDKVSVKRWRADNPEAVAKFKKRWVDKNPSKVREMHLRSRYKKYGITEEIFERIWESQNGRCAICEIELLRSGHKSNSVAVDHEHRDDGSGPVRGLLCFLCNRWLGVVESSWYHKALDYLSVKGSR